MELAVSDVDAVVWLLHAFHEPPDFLMYHWYLRTVSVALTVNFAVYLHFVPRIVGNARYVSECGASLKGDFADGSQCLWQYYCTKSLTTIESSADTTWFSIVTVSSSVQPENVSLLTFVSLSGNTIDFKCFYVKEMVANS